MLSAYKSGHSTDVAILDLKNDTMMPIDGRMIVVLLIYLWDSIPLIIISYIVGC